MLRLQLVAFGATVVADRHCASSKIDRKQLQEHCGPTRRRLRTPSSE